MRASPAGILGLLIGLLVNPGSAALGDLVPYLRVPGELPRTDLTVRINGVPIETTATAMNVGYADFAFYGVAKVELTADRVWQRFETKWAIAFARSLHGCSCERGCHAWAKVQRVAWGRAVPVEVQRVLAESVDVLREIRAEPRNDRLLKVVPFLGELESRFRS